MRLAGHLILRIKKDPPLRKQMNFRIKDYRQPVKLIFKLIQTYHAHFQIFRGQLTGHI
jgi:hypothetical protein